MPTISEALAIAVANQQAGRLDAAEQIYEQILQVQPGHADAWHLRGLVAHQRGQDEVALGHLQRAIAADGRRAVFHNSAGEAYRALGRIAEAEACYRRALELQPDCAPAHSNLGIALHGRGEFDPAVVCFRQALAIQPDLPEAHCNLGTALHRQGDPEPAAACFRQAIALRPAYAEAYNSLGRVLLDLGRLDEAVGCYRQAIQLRPNFAGAYSNLAYALRAQGQLDGALACCRHAVQLAPDLAEAHNNFGEVLRLRGELTSAVDCYRRALELKPDFTEAHCNLGVALQRLRRLDEAVACYRRAVELNSCYAEALGNLGGALKESGQLDEAIACFRRALEVDPLAASIHSDLLFTLQLLPDATAESIGAEHRRFCRRHAQPLAAAIRPHVNDRSPERRLRIGYVSPDFRSHPVGQFMLPLLEAHDRQAVEVFCYASVPTADAITDQCRAQADVWRDVARLSDAELAATVRADGIDILVDLAMHTEGGRLLAFARKPAPVQVTYLAYCGTTGLSAIDYRLTDPYFDPPGRPEPFYAEQSVHLPETYWCYRPLTDTPPVGPLPAATAGHVTFGCLNSFYKASVPALETWGRLLGSVADSQLVLHAGEGSQRQALRDRFARAGVSPERIVFVDRLPLEEYFRLHQQIDIALDPFPYAGGMTTCNALWMGVPVVSLAGATAVGRGGVSVLSNLGLTGLVAGDRDQYVRIAAELAADRPRLADLRATLRDRLQQSPLMDASRFARGVESAYRRMWHRWCAATPP